MDAASEAGVHASVTEALPATAERPVGASGGATATMPSVNERRSTLNSVSVPSPVAGVTTGGVPGAPGVTTAGVLLLSVTVTDPLVLVVTVYCDAGPLK